ncbi:hypothetical protein RHMOL_Rhmol03G0150800 [Rhododendron molle]|uniref:Uncharacterized protein n=1 Tax=Rhododendron molle TaxID=49168 RepID=A0ACC0PGT8_RHOML|nr:hypothetical protein RHMOL_Rhmol03G0150800 [Rhododendron molle]
MWVSKLLMIHFHLEMRLLIPNIARPYLTRKVFLSYMGQSMWPNMMPHNMRPNMTQGESIFQFSPSSCPTGTGFNQFMYAFSSSQTNMSTNSTLFNSHDWRGHSNITSTQVWGGGQSNFLETQGQCVGGPPPSSQTNMPTLFR